jgi:SAM-dependent methyltransferase
MMKTNPPPQIENFLTLDELGYFFLEEKKVTSHDIGQHFLENLNYSENGSFTTSLEDTHYFIEVFDEPILIRELNPGKRVWGFVANYDFEGEFELKTLRLDEWDRFHGRTTNGIPFVFTAKAQDAFFNLVDDYDDESVTWQGQKVETPSLWGPAPHLNGPKWWSDIYQAEANPRWNLQEPAEALKDMLPRIKLAKSRVLVLGCGEGHDAALFAREGHRVVAVDISAEAIARAQAQYSGIGQIDFIQKDLFELDPQQNFDVVFEHTCYCAIDPQRRVELAKAWSRHLMPGGFFMGIFFTYDKFEGPPFGASEWEIRQRLQKDYHFLFWGRWRKSLPRRQGRELYVLAQKKRQI